MEKKKKKTHQVGLHGRNDESQFGCCLVYSFIYGAKLGYMEETMKANLDVAWFIHSFMVPGGWVALLFKYRTN